MSLAQDHTAPAEDTYSELLEYMDSLKAEDERHIREVLTEVELELYDLLRKDKMTAAEEIRVKNAARSLLNCDARRRTASTASVVWRASAYAASASRTESSLW